MCLTIFSWILCLLVNFRRMKEVAGNQSEDHCDNSGEQRCCKQKGHGGCVDKGLDSGSVLEVAIIRFAFRPYGDVREKRKPEHLE